MPSLSAIITGDSRPFQRATQDAAVTALANFKKIANSLAETSVALEGQIALAKRAGTAYAAYETELAAVNTELAAMNIQIAEQEALIATTATETAADTARMVPNVAQVMRELFIIVGEFARGQHGQALASFRRLADYLGVLRFIVTPVGFAIMALAGAVWYLHRSVKEMAAQSDAFNASMEDSKGKFEQLADAIKQNADNMREAARAAADFKDWLDKLAISRETLADLTDENIRIMQEEFQLQQEIARQRGQTDAQGRGAEQAERVKELAAYTKALAAAQKDSAASLAQANRSETDYETFLKNRREGEDPISKLIERAKMLDQAMSQISPNIAAQMQHLHDIMTGKAPEEPATRAEGTFGPIETSPAWTKASATAEFNRLYNQYFGNLMVDGKKMRASMAEVDYAFMDLSAKAKFNAKMQQELTDTETKLKQAVDNAKDQHDKNSQTVEELQKKEKELKDTIALHAAYDKQFQDETRARAAGGAGRQEVTERERIGAAGSLISVSLLDVAKQHRDISAKILQTIQSNRMQNPDSVGGAYFGG